jgi:uncharacterized membrane protein YkgB
VNVFWQPFNFKDDYHVSTSQRRFALVRRLTISVVFIVSAILKFRQPGNSWAPGQVPMWMMVLTGKSMGISAAIVETVIGIGVLSRFWMPFVWVAATASIALLSIALTIVAFGYDLAKCGCFGSIELSMQSHVVVLLGVGLICYSCVREWESHQLAVGSA